MKRLIVPLVFIGVFSLLVSLNGADFVLKTDSNPLGSWTAFAASAGTNGIWTNADGQYRAFDANAESLVFGSNTTSASEFTISLGVRNVIGTSSGSSGILSGTNNWISNSIVGGFIGGGNRNTIRTGAATTPTIGGGSDNIVRASYGTVAGGTGNDVRLSGGFIGGGDNNLTGTAGVQTGQAIAGGSQNVANGLYAFIGAGLVNEVNLNAGKSAIVSGVANLVGGGSAFIGSGEFNVISGEKDVIVGGYTNYASATYGFIGSGISNRVGGTSFGALSSLVVGGASNIVVDASDYSAILGGSRNAVSADFAAILAGEKNAVTANHGVVVAGLASSVTATNAVAVGSGVTNATASTVALSGFNRVTTDFALNTYYTNNAPFQRAQVSMCFTNTSTITASALVGLYIDDNADGTFENTGTVVGSLSGVAVSILSVAVNNVQPGGRFVFTNLSDAGGTVAIRTGSSNWTKE